MNKRQRKKKDKKIEKKRIQHTIALSGLKSLRGSFAFTQAIKQQELYDKFHNPFIKYREGERLTINLPARFETKVLGA